MKGSKKKPSKEFWIKLMYAYMLSLLVYRQQAEAVELTLNY